MQKTIEDYVHIGKEKGFEFLGENPRCVKDKYNWKCSNGHVLFVNFICMKRHYNKGCPYCHNNRLRIKEEDYLILAREINFTLINVGRTTREKGEWICPNGHKIYISYDSLSSGSGCLECSKLIRPCLNKKTEEDYHKLARARNAKFIGTLPLNTREKAIWECACGNSIIRTYRSIGNILACEDCRRSGQYIKIENPKARKSLSKRSVMIDPESIAWSRNVYKIFNYKCIKCERNKNLTAHHIYDWVNFPELRKELNNGICLCENCHKSFHSVFGKKGNNMNQLLEFVPNLGELLIIKNNKILSKYYLDYII